MRRPKPRIGNQQGVRSGVYYLLMILILAHLLPAAIAHWGSGKHVQPGIQVHTLLQGQLDSIRTLLEKKRGWALQPMDPNHLDDYRGYLLGIPARALDCLYAHRSRWGRLENMDQFRKVSGLPDTTCSRLELVFRFPEGFRTDGKTALKTTARGKDLNAVTAADLRTIPGIGPVFSRRIVRFRKVLGGFLHPDQLYDVYGLEPEVARRVMQAFPLNSIPRISRLDINKARADQLASLAYLTRRMAEAIITHRDSAGPFRNAEDLRAVRGLPQDRIDRIALYLKF